ncbi:alpha/beta hydrolase [Nonomuraea soli]|uniref:Acetyl esterase/lipase n=1 Tax=Nonomuraea soli TaxID=1032476 RepID=A0A7W0CRZ2_9ACTN|nr:alpha/beta hydrolase [Nonomuraea soli]MBA2896202.1 acetyl esterase/lipase [Nonomuraea soli]
MSLSAMVLALTMTVSYGPQSMDVLPGDGGRRPGVFLVHGGWWSEGDKSALASVARRFSALGYAVFNLNYRLSGTARWPAQRDDTIGAIEHARRNAARYRFDPSRYVLVGFSAGGHVAASVGVDDRRPPGLRGVVGFSPVSSPRLAYDTGGRLGRSARALAGCSPRVCPRVWRSMEVAEHADPGDPPMLAFHAAGEFVPPAHSLPLRPLAEVRVLPGAGHSTRLYGMRSVSRAAEKWIKSII